ncbi:hypothetical protein GCM10025876_24970 [Demequina litorisediminis]|uniref:Uncharacterized protein n=1 Tax=Demequina litorisediminis TaxID=1849022 RepID=A0ABQ6IEI6_9MICO|nr:hypothetical protein GCM10025876_24970 [Demequina litorisediminis]
MNTVWLIARREFRVRTLSKASIISSAIMIAVIVIGAIVAKPFLADDGEPAVVQVDTATAAALVPYLDATAQAQDADYVFEEANAPAEPALGEDVSALVVGPVESPTLYVEDGDDTLAGILQAATQAAVLDAQVTALGGDPAAVSTALAASVPTVELLGDGSSSFDSGEFFAGFVVILILFFVLIQSLVGHHDGRGRGEVLAGRGDPAGHRAPRDPARRQGAWRGAVRAGSGGRDDRAAAVCVLVPGAPG